MGRKVEERDEQSKVRLVCSHLQGASLWAWMDLPKEAAMDSMLPGASSEGAPRAHSSLGKEPQAASLTPGGGQSKPPPAWQPGCLVPQALLATGGPAATLSTQAKHVFVITSVTRARFQLQEQH